MENKEIKVQRIPMDATKDHLIPHLTGKKTAKEMFEAPVGLYLLTTQIAFEYLSKTP